MATASIKADWAAEGAERQRDISRWHRYGATGDPAMLENFYTEEVPFLDLSDRNTFEYVALPLTRKLNPALARRLAILFYNAISAPSQSERWHLSLAPARQRRTTAPRDSSARCRATVSMNTD